MRRLSVGICLTALVTLVLELALTRVFDVILSPNMAYMVITCAVLAFGLAGLYATLWPLSRRTNLNSVLAWLAALLAVTLVTLRPALNFLPFNFDHLFTRPLRQAIAFGALYLVLVIPFFVSGLILTTVFSRYARDIRRLYFWDLVGAAVGCVVLIPFLPLIGPGGILFLAAALALVTSALFSNAPRWRAGAVTAAVALAIVPVVVPASRLEFREHQNKRGVQQAQEKGTIAFSRWDPISKIDVIPIRWELGRVGDSLFVSNAKWHVAYDGGDMSTHFFAFDGDLAGLRARIDRGEPGAVMMNFWTRGVLASHYLKRDQGQRVLIFGSAGGQETKAALVYGASHVDGIELVKTVVDLGKGPYAQDIGDLFHRPDVNVRVGEGRSFLRASADRYDIIQIFSNFTSSSIATGNGAMTPSYLHTKEAYREYFDHLTPNGILHINHLGYPRMITTAALAWHEMGRGDFRKHVVVLERPDQPETLPTLLIKMQPWTPSEIADLKHFFSMDTLLEGPRRMVEDPLNPAASFLSADFYSGQFPNALAAAMPWRATPLTDDRPFFFLFRKHLGKIQADPAGFLSPSVADILNQQLGGGKVPLDLIHLVVVGVVSLVFSVLSIGLPLAFAPVGRRQRRGKAASMTYFACLGAGFIMLELVLIQVFMRLIGYPLYTYSVVIFVLLLAAGLGSRLSESLGISPERRWAWPFIGVLASGTVLMLSHGAIFTVFLAASLPVRLAVAAMMIFPLGVFLGMPFPLGILVAERQPHGAVAWAWGLNGVFTVVGGLASVLLAIAWGFQLTILAALGVYTVAFASFHLMRPVRTDRLEAVELMPSRRVA